MPETVRVRPWPDPVIDTLGHDPRSLYVETFWLPTLGPTSLLLLRHLARRFEERDEPFELPVAKTSQALGLGPREGRNSPLVKSFGRLAQFDVAYAHSDGTVAVRRALPPISRRHVHRLPEHLRDEHEHWLSRGESPRDRAVGRARRMAFTLVELGNDVDLVERSLHAMGFPPLVCREAAVWAQSAHRSAGPPAGGDAVPVIAGSDGTVEQPRPAA